ncbi:FlgD immunoglobulin-like domain containing protein [Brevibacillus parabrevis]|uniref:FlgD immunoglobulin-like domain containing protein n=1 Tax=Brevibacillus parabrevis TaxID=54914 RepID=UPI002E1BFB15|nr:FlgD immunoglobulin-like domain containing protein [Brevibacillus parabrevis]
MSVKVYVKSETGKGVRMMDFGLLNKGWNEKDWDGKDNNGQAVSYGNYTFVFQVIDLADNEVWLEDPGQKMKVADIYGTTVTQTSLKKGSGNEYEEMSVIPAQTKVTIMGETTDWYQVSFYQNNRGYEGYVPKSALATRSDPNSAPKDETNKEHPLFIPYKPATHCGKFLKSMECPFKRLLMQINLIQQNICTWQKTDDPSSKTRTWNINGYSCGASGGYSMENRAKILNTESVNFSLGLQVTAFRKVVSFCKDFHK